jgi:uncharacterized RDD family membrane protein YckC
MAETDPLEGEFADGEGEPLFAEDESGPFFAEDESGAWTGEEVKDLAGGYLTRIVRQPLGSRHARFFARLIDSFCVVVSVLPGFGAATSIANNNASIVQSAWSRGSYIEALKAFPTIGLVTIGLGLCAIIGIQICLLTREGQSLGKKLCRLRIVDNNTDSIPGFVHVVLLREVVLVGICFAPGYWRLMVLLDAYFIFTRDKRCLHDYLARTRVVKA